MPTRDLSHPLNADVTVYPGDPAVEFTPAATHAEDGYRVTEVRLGSHSGTHVDAPSHTEPDGRAIDEFDVSEFAFDARLVDCTEVGAREAIRLTDLPDDLDGKEDPEKGPEMLVFRTGWDDHWGTDRYFDHPYLSPEVAAWCAERGYHVGLDVLSPDPSPSEESRKSSSEQNKKSSSEKDADATPESDGVPAHRELLGSERFVLENLTGLGDLPARFELRAYPLSLAGSDGSPVRAVAEWS